MKTKLRTILHQYIIDHNPELLLRLQEDYTVSRYIDDKVTQVMQSVQQWLAAAIPVYEVEEMALRSMTIELRPSRYLYLKEVLETEFPKEAEAFIEAGVFTFELVNIIEHCKNTFETFGFSEDNQDNRKLRYVIVADIADYLN